MFNSFKRRSATRTLSGRKVSSDAALIISERGERHAGLNVGKLQRRRARNKAASATRRAQRKAAK